MLNFLSDKVYISSMNYLKVNKRLNCRGRQIYEMPLFIIYKLPLFCIYEVLLIRIYEVRVLSILCGRARVVLVRNAYARACRA